MSSPSSPETGEVHVAIIVDVDGHTFRFHSSIDRKPVGDITTTHHAAWRAAQNALEEMKFILESYGDAGYGDRSVTL